jgi:protoporphyrinogen oxidase
MEKVGFIIDTLILGAGISGISAGYHGNLSYNKCLILEKGSSYGGLLDNFVINGFTFDNFVHFSFTKNEYVKKLFADSTDYELHQPNPFNYSNGLWIKHPVQNNLHALPMKMRLRIVIGFLFRRKNKKLISYEDYLHASYGKYFSSLFPSKYTRKYWRTDPKDLGVEWVGNRMYKPSLKEVLVGTLITKTNEVYYTGEMRYPIRGGFKSFLFKMVENLEINYESKVVNINPKDKVVTTERGEKYRYNRLISSIPLPEYLSLLNNIPTNVVLALQNLKWTSAAIISMGFNRVEVAKHLWFYIYDEDILASRIHSPSLKSSNNAPNGCSSLQAEVYFTHKDEAIDPNKLMNEEINRYIQHGFFHREDLIFSDIKFLKYANVVFDHEIYKNRVIVRSFLREVGIETIGRFGEWDYFWTDQSLLSGRNVVQENGNF